MRFFLSILLVLFIVVSLVAVHADEYDDITKKLTDLQHSLQLSQKATATNEVELTKLTVQLQAIKNQVASLEQAIAVKEKEVKDGESALVYQKTLLNERAVSYYKNLNKNSFGVVEILVSQDIAKTLETFFYQKSVQDEDRRTITKVVLYIKDLEDKKTSLLAQHERLSVIKAEVDKQSQFMAGEVAKAKAYETKLQNQIASLSAQQQQLLAQKLAGLNIPQSAYAGAGGSCSSDLTNGKDPGFSPRFGFFTYGVPNRVGLNQYGAYGRAKAGQKYEEILRAYYNFDSLQDFDVNTNINVEGNGSYTLEEYVKRVYEVPNDWGDKGGMDALRAQAIAARSYVLAYTNKGAGSICTTENCQVFKPGGTKGGNWDKAVDDTRGKVMVQGGNPIKAWFSSTHGGYIFSSGDIGWSGTGWTKNAKDFSGDVGSFSDLQGKAYDRDSPWFYCDWGSRSEYAKTAWLKSDEIADIVNALMLAKRDSSTQNHLSQPDKPNPDGTDTWDHDRVKSELRNRGGTPFNSVESVSVDWDKGSGRTSSVNVSGDGGSVSFNGGEFKSFFNLRAPANIQIVGPLFNAEKR